MRWTSIAIVAGFLAGCDQKADSPLQPGLGSGTGGSGSSTGGTKDTAKDTTTDTLPGTAPSFDSTVLWGPSTPLTPGTDRRIVFFLTDRRTLRVVASSDGAPAGGTGPTVGRQTDWEVLLSSKDSIHGSFATNSTEPLLRDTLWNFRDTLLGRSLRFVRMRLHTLSGEPVVQVVADSGARIDVSVQAWSGKDDLLVGWTPPYLPPDSVSRLVWGGRTPVRLGASTFRVRLP